MKKIVAFAVLLLAVVMGGAFGAPAPRPASRARADPDADLLASELARFPSADDCYMWIDAADDFLRWSEKQMILFPFEREQWEECRAGARLWREVWRNLQCAHYPYWRTEERWQALAQVREAVGERNYALGFLWPPVAAHMWSCD